MLKRLSKKTLAIFASLLLMISCCKPLLTLAEDTPTRDAVNDDIVVNEDSQITFDPRTNDTNAAGAIIIGLNSPSNGSVGLNDDETVTYTPNPDYYGQDSFTYQIGDGGAGFKTATVTVTVTSVNDIPEAMDDSADINEGTAVTIDVLSNDKDKDNNDPVTTESDTLVLSSITNPAHGTAEIVSGKVTYTPNTDYYGTDTFDYVVSDGKGGTDTGTVTISINQVSSIKANNDTVSVNEDDSVTINVLSNDMEEMANELIIITYTEPTHGTLELVYGDSGSGTLDHFVYTPNTNYNGSDSFTYTVTNFEVSATAQVDITVAAVNDKPVAKNFSASINEESNYLGQLVGEDIDGDALTFELVSNASAAGTFVINSDGSFTYTCPAAGFVGTESVTFRVYDGHEYSEPATLELNVAEVNKKPVVTPSSFTVNEDSSYSGSVTATDPDGDTLTYILVKQPSHGLLSLGTDGNITYTPTANYSGTDSFSYKVNDGGLDSDECTVTINVNPLNDIPTISGTDFNVNEETIYNGKITVVDLDNEATTFEIVENVKHGTLTLLPNGNFTYTGALNYYGPDSFKVIAKDATSSSTELTINITVKNINDAPVANNNTITIDEDSGTYSGNVTASDADGNILSYTRMTTTSHGTLTFVNSTGAFTYTPQLNFNGNDSFTFTAKDGLLTSAIATITFVVNSVNDLPVVSEIVISLNEDANITKAFGGTDVDLQTLSYSAPARANHGAVTVNADGTFSYVADANYFGTDTFMFLANDGIADSAQAEVKITVVNVQDAPIAIQDSATMDENTSISISVLTNDYDVDNDEIFILGLVQSTYGSISGNADGTFTVTPVPNYYGVMTFYYTITDNFCGISRGKIVVTVIQANRAPVANGLSLSTKEEEAVSGKVTATDVNGDSLTFAVDTQGVKGSVSMQQDGRFTYTPQLNATGDDSFTYIVSDGKGGTNTGTVNISISPINDKPVASDDTVSVGVQESITIDVLSNDIDVDGDTLTISFLAVSRYGNIQISGNKVIYMSKAGMSGKQEKIRYMVKDAANITHYAYIIINIT